MDEIVGSYILKDKVGHGSFGQIYTAMHRFTGEQFAAKVEDSEENCPQLVFESKIYEVMKGAVNVPRVFYISEGQKRNVMVMNYHARKLILLLRIIQKA